MTFSDTEMNELGRSTWNDTHNITSMMRTPQYVSNILQTEEIFTVEEYKQRNTYTHTHTHTHINIFGVFDIFGS